jgi:RNA polymerase sigma-70 factor (ECF subfamily)
MTDQELITGILNHDKTVIQHLVSTYHREVIKTAYHFVQDMDDAEDLAQDVCIEILESAKHFRGSASLSTWIYRITVNKSLNFIRKNKRKQFVRQFETFFGNTKQYGSEETREPMTENNDLHHEENRQLLNKAISLLPENQRIAFVLNKYEELSYKEIAGIMNTSVASVESLLSRAKQNLQKKLISHFSEYANKK